MQDMQRNPEALSCNHCCRGKVIIVTYSECVFVALVIRLASRVRHITLLSVAVFFSHYLINGTIFGGKNY